MRGAAGVTAWTRHKQLGKRVNAAEWGSLATPVVTAPHARGSQVVSTAAQRLRVNNPVALGKEQQFSSAPSATRLPAKVMEAWPSASTSDIPGSGAVQQHAPACYPA